MPTPCKKLIEVALPVKEISFEAVRDKSIRHGHISTLHLWWARRPLPVCRAVVFASLVPDPLDPECPLVFIEAVRYLLLAEGEPTGSGITTNTYQPYGPEALGVADTLEDNERNRLLAFIGRFSKTYIENEQRGKKTPPKEVLAPFSLVKWESRTNEVVLTLARKLIFVAHNAAQGSSLIELIESYVSLWEAIRQAERNLERIPNRHLRAQEVQDAEVALSTAKDNFMAKMPRVFDPFTGGGAIPLESARLGCRTYGNDINPVAHIIQLGSLVFPQQFGYKATYSQAEFGECFGKVSDFAQYNTVPQQVADSGDVEVKNRLAFEVEFYAHKMLALAKQKAGHLYPSRWVTDIETGQRREVKTIAYYWARTATCSNPSCGAKVPLLKGFKLCDTDSKKIGLKPNITENEISFEVVEGLVDIDSWNTRGNLFCPVCKSTSVVNKVKTQFVNGSAGLRPLAVIQEGIKGKEYRLPTKEEEEILMASLVFDRPSEPMPTSYTQAMPSCTWGVATWGDLFSPRQLFTLQAFIKAFAEIKTELNAESNPFNKAVITYLAIWFDRIALNCTTFGIWDISRESLKHPYGRQAIPMVFDFPESNPFCDSSGSATNQLDWICRYLEEEKQGFSVELQNASSGDKLQFPAKFLNAVVTDPPYYDAIAYADLSDFFYVWLKRTLSDVYPENFATPQTPKGQECTALKHHHAGNVHTAKSHFEGKLLEIFGAIEQQTMEVVAIMFAHQSTEAWSTLCHSVLGANMNFTGSWAMDSEMTGALKTGKDFLSGSVTVACRPSDRNGTGSWKRIQDEMQERINEEVKLLYKLGFRGADLLTACFGQAVGVFGRYEHVENALGDEITVSELLELARKMAFKAVVNDFDADASTRFYIGALQLYGFEATPFSEMQEIAQYGLELPLGELENQLIVLTTTGNKKKIATTEERAEFLANQRMDENTSLINLAHAAMHLYDKRTELLAYLRQHAPGHAADPLWRILTALESVLPTGKDKEAATSLLVNKDSLVREAKADTLPKAGDQLTIDTI